jgi:D-alanine--poly(phosphoribitol) ligase subunit 2
LREEILRLVYLAIDDVEARSVDGVPVEKTPDAPLLGASKGIDSLTFVNLVVAIEEQIHKAMGKSVVLIEEDNIALQEHPFRTVGTLANYVERVIDKQRPN